MSDPAVPLAWLNVDTEPSMQQQVSQARRLDYQPIRRRLYRLGILCSVFIIIAAFASWKRFGASAWNRAKILYQQRQCMNFQPAPGTFAAAPDCWTGFRKSLPPDEGSMGGTLIFLHQLQSPGGSRRLVALYIRPNFDHMQLCSIDATVVDPAGIRTLGGYDYRVVNWVPGWSDDVDWKKLHWATIDPADPSHVIFKYDAPEKDWDHLDAPSKPVPTTLHFWLTDSGKISTDSPHKAPAQKNPATRPAKPSLQSLMLGPPKPAD